MGCMKAGAAIAVLATLWVAGAWAADGADARLLAQGDKQWTAGKPDEARKSFEQAVVIAPHSIDAGMKLAGLQLASRDYAVAIASYQRTISLDGNNAKAWIGLGMAYLHGGQPELARAAFGEAVRADPGRKAQLARLLDQPAD